jgi:hypothetical protein
VQDIQHAWNKKGAHMEFWWGNLREGVCFENQDVEGIGILKLTLEKYNDSVWPGLV